LGLLVLERLSLHLGKLYSHLLEHGQLPLVLHLFQLFVLAAAAAESTLQIGVIQLVQVVVV
jgi:hypothetical protein